MKSPARRKPRWLLAIVFPAACALLPPLAFAAPPAAAPAGSPPAVLIEGLGPVHHPVSTKKAEAQKFFDQGLALVYGFNHAEAARAFRRAAELDPALAIAHWGEALALGPNINLPQLDKAAEKAAFDASRRALALAGGASEKERAYIDALAKRYSDDPNADLRKHAEVYHEAMGEVSRTYPDDLDAATLYAESGMNLRPWKLYTKDGRPEPGTEAIVATLESVLKRNPDHIGANHYYIHAVEASTDPGRALPSAERLPKLAPAAGHLVHMPAHVYMRVGRYADAVRANQGATAADEKYIACHGPKGIYPAMYYNHNVHFLAAAACMSGQSKLAIESADKLAANIGAAAKTEPGLEALCAYPLAVRVRFGRWDDILAQPEPDAALPVTRATWHFARGMAYAAKKDVARAEAEQKAFLEASKKAGDAPVGLNTWSGVVPVPTGLLAAKIALAKDDTQGAAEALQRAVAAQDEFAYDEPPGWPWPAREMLGRVMLLRADPGAAERAFRDDLVRNPNNPRSLFGLAGALEARGVKADADAARKAFEAAWKDGDFKLTSEDL